MYFCILLKYLKNRSISRVFYDLYFRSRKRSPSPRKPRHDRHALKVIKMGKWPVVTLTQVWQECSLLPYISCLSLKVVSRVARLGITRDFFTSGPRGCWLDTPPTIPIRKTFCLFPTETLKKHFLKELTPFRYSDLRSLPNSVQ